MNKKILSRLIILCGCVAGTLMLAQPARAFTCLEDCNTDFQNCTQAGELGCDDVYFACINRC